MSCGGRHSTPSTRCRHPSFHTTATLAPTKGRERPSLETVAWLTLKVRATSACEYPSLSRWMASWRWCGVRACGRPNFTPRAFARAPAIAGRGKDQLALELRKPPRTVSISRPCDVVVSAQLSLSDLKPAPILATQSRMLSKSRVERASLSRRIIISTSPSPSRLSSFSNSTRSLRAPLTFSA